jgi:group I intron endonuclease
MFCIYLVTNINNGKIYVGQSYMTPYERLKNHFWSRKKQDYFHAAIRRHGDEAFIVRSLGEYVTQTEVDDAENFWIVALQSCDREIGYNTTLGGKFGAEMTKEVRAKIGESRRGKLHSEDTKSEMSRVRSGEGNSFFGRHHKPESIETARKKLKIALGGENNPWYGKTLSDEHKAKISASQKGRKQKPRTPEHCLAMSMAATSRWA